MSERSGGKSGRPGAKSGRPRKSGSASGRSSGAAKTGERPAGSSGSSGASRPLRPSRPSARPTGRPAARPDRPGKATTNTKAAKGQARDASVAPARRSAAEPRPKRPGTPPAKVTIEQRRHLRGLAHPLKPLLAVGKDGVTDSFVKSVQEVLIDHELVKVRLLRSCPLDKAEVAEILPSKSGAMLVQMVGKTLTLYAPHPTEPTIVLPRP